MLQPRQVARIVENHDNYWSGRRAELKSWHDVYMTRFWAGSMHAKARNYVEVAKAFAVVESYLGALYAKNPSVVVQPDLRATGNPPAAQAVANHFLLRTREQIEDATRLALIFPSSALKLAPVEDIDPLRRIAIMAIPPWELVLDRSAPEWSRQRYVGHSYQMPLAEARMRYSRPANAFVPRAFQKWLDVEDGPYQSQGRYGEVADERDWVRVVEMYDLIADRLLVWSPDYANGDKYLFRGVRVQKGALDAEAGVDEQEEMEVETVTTGIPFRTSSNRPIVPIVPMYFARDPSCPLDGYSLVGRIYDQLRELNVFRSYTARGVRRMARQWLVRKGLLDEEAVAKINEGRDGEMIEIDLPPGAELTGAMIPVPSEPIPGDITAYQGLVEADIQASGVNAPFVSGEVTGVTATENRLLAEYTASQLGRMVRARDAVIAEIAKVYNVMLAVTLADEGEPLVLPNVGPIVLTAQDLEADYTYWAADAGSSPMADQAKRDEMTQLVPLLLQLGVAPESLRSEMIRMYGLPETLLLPPEAPPSAEEVPNAEVPGNGIDAGGPTAGPGDGGVDGL
jgi:hypothetical protein